jgi:hypothetical protein
MDTITQQIILYGSTLEVGETIREVCPRCDGGSSREKSLTITLGEDGKLVWNCFRTKCPGVKGTNDHNPSQHREPSPLVKKVRRFEGQTRALTDVQLNRIRTLWGISDPPYWYWTDDLGGRIAMSIRSPKYAHRGWVMRSVNPNAQAKALTYINPEEEGMSWYREHPQAPTILVEDIPSAVRAAAYLNSVALCGTGVGIAKAQEIAEYAGSGVIIALDQDATAQAFKIAEKWSLLWGNVKVLPLTQDIKDMKEKKLCDLLQSL